MDTQPYSPEGRATYRATATVQHKQYTQDYSANSRTSHEYSSNQRESCDYSQESHDYSTNQRAARDASANSRGSHDYSANSMDRSRDYSANSSMERRDTASRLSTASWDRTRHVLKSLETFSYNKILHSYKKIKIIILFF